MLVCFIIKIVDISQFSINLIVPSLVLNVPHIFWVRPCLRCHSVIVYHMSLRLACNFIQIFAYSDRLSCTSQTENFWID